MRRTVSGSLSRKSWSGRILPFRRAFPLGKYEAGLPRWERKTQALCGMLHARPPSPFNITLPKLTPSWVFWTAGAASLTAAYGGGVDCSSSDLVYCNQNMAAEAFAWIEWILITITFVLVAVIGVGAVRRGDRLSGGLV